MYEFIQHNQGLLMGVFFILSLAGLAVAVFFGVLIRHTEKKADQRLKQARADITDMTILFQTMRDIIGQQKALARDFNEELEHKMEQVKHILNQGMEKNKQLYDKQQRIAIELEEAQARIDGLYRQLAQNPPAAGPNGAPAPTAAAPERATSLLVKRPIPHPVAPPAPAPSAVTPSEQKSVPAPRPADAPTMDPRDVPGMAREQRPRPARPLSPAPQARQPALSPAEEARLADTGVTRAPFTSWIAEDLLEREGPAPRREAPRRAEPDPADRGPGNGDAAREAFRALLNMPAPREQETAPLDVIPGGEAWPVQAEPETASVPLQQRVLEYSEAGMTIAQVSRELGIGKGEVRLMLSLAKQQAPPRA